jgi:L-asparaginase
MVKEYLSKTVSEKDSILLIYTGGTIGAVPSDPADPTSPLEIASWETFRKGVPQLQLLRDRGLRIDAVALDPALDSTNIEPEHWSIFVDIIAKHYHNYMGFVILHGTDTMVYTASALSFMLRGLAKPVVLTGSQIPILGFPETDGIRNLVNAIFVAAWQRTGLPRVPEVCIAFDNVLIRGNRARKRDADSFTGFESPNYPPLGLLEHPIKIDTKLLLKTKKDLVFRPGRTLNPNVISLQIFPGIQSSSILSQCFSLDSLKGVVLQAYGTGNAPSSDSFLEIIRKATETDGKIIIDVTQCFRGSVRLGQYETGIGLLKNGVLTGSDMTPEAALCKLMVLLAREDTDAEVSRRLQRCEAGEQSESVHSSKYGLQDGKPWELKSEGARLDLTPTAYDTGWESGSVSSAWLHLHDGLIGAAVKEVVFEIYIDLGRGEEPQSHKLAGAIRKQPIKSPSFISFNISDGMRSLQEPGKSPRISIILKSDAEVSFSGATLLVFVDERN